MPDFEPDQESASRAATLSARLMRDVRSISQEGLPSKMRREIFSEQRYSEQAEGVPINDVVTNVGQMAAEFAMARRFDNEVLCWKLDDGEVAPISMTEYFGGPFWPSYGSEDWVEFWERYMPFPFPPHRFVREILRNAEERDERLMVTDVSQIEKSVERGLGGFLAYRFAGMKKWIEWIQGTGGSRGPFGGIGSGTSSLPPPLAVGPSGGLQVQVSCRTPGLRIHVSPAYFISWVFWLLVDLNARL